MYRGTNPSAIRSRDEIIRAFLLLLETTAMDDINIKQLMDETGLSRQTFYQIFASKEEILEYYLDTVFTSFIEHSDQHTVGDLCDAAKIFFAFFADYKHTLSLIIKSGKSCVVQRKCREYLKNDNYIHYTLSGVRSPAEYDLATTFVISGIVAILEQWIREKPEFDAAQLASLVCRITDGNNAVDD